MTSFFRGNQLCCTGSLTMKTVPWFSWLSTKNLPLAQLYDSAHQGQAQAFSCGSVGGIRLIEFIENMPEVLLPDSNAFVPDPDRNEAIRHPGGDMDFSVVMAVFDGVANQISPDVIHHLRIVSVGQPEQIHIKDNVSLRPLAFHTEDAGADLLVQVIFRLVCNQGLIFIFGNQQNGAGQFGQPLRLFRNELQVLLLLLLGQVAAAQTPSKPPDGHNGGFEFMGEDIDMETIKKNLASLIKVKTIVTMVVIAVFAVLALRGDIGPDNAMVIISMVVSFYFGTQHEKTQTESPTV